MCAFPSFALLILEDHFKAMEHRPQSRGCWEGARQEFERSSDRLCWSLSCKYHTFQSVCMHLISEDSLACCFPCFDHDPLPNRSSCRQCDCYRCSNCRDMGCIGSTRREGKDPKHWSQQLYSRENWDSLENVSTLFRKCTPSNIPLSAKIAPAVNQIEAHAYLQQPKLLEWSKSKVRQLIHLQDLLILTPCRTSLSQPIVL